MDAKAGQSHRLRTDFTSGLHVEDHDDQIGTLQRRPFLQTFTVKLAHPKPFQWVSMKGVLMITREVPK
jgi:hypothetical protein